MLVTKWNRTHLHGIVAQKDVSCTFQPCNFVGIHIPMEAEMIKIDKFVTSAVVK